MNCSWVRRSPLEAVEDESGAVVLSYRKAQRQKQWQQVIEKHREGDVVAGLKGSVRCNTTGLRRLR
jgi:ribosomal protein S1